MAAMSQFRKLVLVLCVAALLLALLSPAASGFPPAILTPFWIFLWILTLVCLAPSVEEAQPKRSGFVTVRSSRAPPAQ